MAVEEGLRSASGQKVSLKSNWRHRLTHNPAVATARDAHGPAVNDAALWVDVGIRRCEWSTGNNRAGITEHGFRDGLGLFLRIETQRVAFKRNRHKLSAVLNVHARVSEQSVIIGNSNIHQNAVFGRAEQHIAGVWRIAAENAECVSRRIVRFVRSRLRRDN